MDEKPLTDSPTDEIPNAETLEAFEELESGNGHHFGGTTDELFAELLS